MNRRRGSALLIVLGFLSFMVVSAVAFSIYMRSERVPSSVYRRSVQSRQLVKAALARAMSELDDAIRDDPFPGVTTSTSRQMGGNVKFTDGGSTPRYLDRWQGRVFMPPDPDMNLDGSYNGNYMASDDDTVSVVTLEGLGYVPPPLLNDVRFRARGSWSSKWRTFNYGAGRFAYVAVNVSDYLDINRVPADESRSSGSRINLSSLFADKFDAEKEGVSEAGTLGNFIDTRGGERSQWPFVSMLDYALAMRNGSAGLTSPFYRWCSQTRSTMYDSGSDTASDQTFVTDSWLPKAPIDNDNAAAIVDLNNRQENDNGGQPFPEESWMKGGKSFEQISFANSRFCRRVADGQTPDGGSGQNKSFLPLTYAMLYDYLDRDDMPVSLALPCVERVPMITGVSLANLSLDVTLQGNAGTPTTTSTPGGGSVTVTETTYVLANSVQSRLDGAQATVSFLFPFKRGSVISGTFRARALLRVFMIQDGASGLRTSSKLASLRPQHDQDSSDWKKSNFSLSGLSASLPPIVFTLESTPVTLSIPTTIRQQKDASRDVSFTFSADASSLSSQALLTKRETTTQAAPVGGLPGATSTTTEWKFSATPFGSDGELLYAASEYVEESKFVAANAGTRYTMQAALWVCIENSAGDVVDLVPAIAADDSVYNDVNNSMVAMEGYDGSRTGTPLLRFKSTATPNPGATPDTFFNIQGASIDQPQGYFAVDPRYNWAPEDYLPVKKQATGDKWINWILGSDNNMESLLDADGRDSDIFMFVSNQGFLQSMGELAFLPRVTDFGNQSQAAASAPSDLLAKNYNGNEHKTTDNWNVIPNADCVWRTYRPYAVNDDGSDHLMEFRNFPGGAMAFRDFGARGFRVNPYTDNDKVLMTAFAYTPYDWWAAAGTNSPNWTTTNSKDSHGARDSRFKELQNSRAYTFNGSSSEARITSDQITAIAQNIRNEIRNNPDKSWETVYDGLDWYGSVEPDNENSFENFLGVKLDEPLHGVDRKYLYAFWRNCLANRQQLFLVFLRAESTALGGSGEGQIPPQQGGHAVALVWRDPEDPINATGSKEQVSQSGTTSVESWVPHQMRVLFFHQFD